MTKLTGSLLACALGLPMLGIAVPGAPVLAQEIQRAPLTRAPLVKAPLRDITTVPPAALPDAVTTGPLTIAANAGWTATGVRLQAGGQVQILVRDGVWSTLGKVPGAAAVRDLTVGAAGYPDTAGQDTLLPSANRGALIGRIGTGAPFLIGARFTGPVATNGELFVSINDAPNALRDNQGAVLVLIRAAPPLPREPPTTKPPETPTAPVPPDTRPDDTRPQDTKPTDPPLPPAEDATPLTPPDDAPPVEEKPLVEQAPAVDLAPTPVQPVAPAIPVIPIAIGAALLAGVLLLGTLFRPRRKPGGDDKRNAGATAQVSTRVVSDGIAGQSLTITPKPERRS